MRAGIDCEVCKVCTISLIKLIACSASETRLWEGYLGEALLWWEPLANTLLPIDSQQ